MSIWYIGSSSELQGRQLLTTIHTAQFDILPFFLFFYFFLLVFFGFSGFRAVAILSNSVGSCDDIGYEAAEKTEKMMKLPVIRHKAKKPSCLKEVSWFY